MHTAKAKYKAYADKKFVLQNIVIVLLITDYTNQYGPKCCAAV